MELGRNSSNNGTTELAYASSPKATRQHKGRSLLTATEDFVSIDIETTGLSPAFDEIIELGAAKYRNGILTETFSSLVKPEMLIDEFITQMTGITDEMLADAPSLPEALLGYINFLGDDILIGHNVNFDINFIYDACNKCNLSPFGNDFIDTMRLARRMYKELSNHKLDTLARYFCITPRTLHRSLNDCVLTAECYQKMLADTERFCEAIEKSYGAYYRGKRSFKDLVAAEGQVNPDSPLYGKVCVFTGALENFTRAEAAQLIINLGGVCADSVTKKTNYLILGNNDYCKSIKGGKSGKQKKAERLIAEGADLLIIPEAVFLDILQMECEILPPEVEIIEKTEAVDNCLTSFEKMEQKAFSLIAPPLKALLEKDNLSSDALYFKQGKSVKAQYSSVYLFNDANLFCRISFRGSHGYFSVSSRFESLFSKELEYQRQASDSNYIRIWMDSPDAIIKHLDLLETLLGMLVDSYPTDFGCCSRYEMCSDVKKCIHPDPEMALRCSYRKNLKNGKIFYGKNKTI